MTGHRFDFMLSLVFLLALTFPIGAQDATRILVADFRFEGATLIDSQTLHSMAARYANSRLNLNELTRVADEITAAYRKRGYIDAFAYIPAQQISDGVVTIDVVEASVDEIKVVGNEYYSSAFVKRHMSRVRREPSPTRAALDRAILVLNQYPSLQVTTFFRAANKPATSNLIVQVQDNRRLAGGLRYDSSRGISPWFQGGSVLREGDLVTLSATVGLYGAAANRSDSGRLEYQAPIGPDGLRLGANYTGSAYHVGNSLAPFRFRGDTRGSGIFATYPAVLRPGQTLTLRAAVDSLDASNYVMGTLDSNDRIRAASVGATLTFVDALQGENRASIAYRRGLPGFLGGAAVNQAGTSRVGAGGDFGKLTLDFRRSQQILGNASVTVALSGQHSDDSLFSGEQFTIGGTGLVRGFPSRGSSGDRGYAATLEVEDYPFPSDPLVKGRRLSDVLRFAVFADHGVVRRNNVQPGEAETVARSSIGAGVRLFGGPHLSIEADWAAPRVDGRFDWGRASSRIRAETSF